MNKTKPANIWALLPLLIFLIIYLVTSIIINDFYKVPISVAFIIASAVSVMMTTDLKFAARVERFSSGASDKNIMLMIWVFILAGAFATLAKEIGSIEATVNVAMNILPSNLLLAGMFIAAGFISLSIGTSVGTIVALTPVAIGIADKAGLELPLMVGVVVGGAFFGDNLSFISDTTIAATRTQNCKMRDKFNVNSLIVLPAVVVLLAFYLFQGWSNSEVIEYAAVEWLKVFPYVAILGCAISGMNVILVLLVGIISTLVVGLIGGDITLLDSMSVLGSGVTGMGELIIITLLAGGMLEMIRYNGGISYIIESLTKRVNSKRGGEFTIAALVSLANICTANNTIAVISVGSIARNISEKFGIDSRKVASILDTYSCFIQGIIPYGAQVLIAAKLSGLSPISIVEYLYYPMLLGVVATLSIIFRYPRRYS